MGIEKLPNVIIFESMNLSIEKLNQLDVWFSNRQYSVIESMGNRIAIHRDIKR
jgi:hypothetical protein